MNMNKKGIIAVAVAILLVIAGILFYLDYQNSPQVQAPNAQNPTSTPSTGTPSANQIAQQTNFAADLLRDWAIVSAKIPLQAGESGKWFLDGIRTIGASTALVAFEDGLNGHVAVVSKTGAEYKIEHLYQSELTFTASDLDAIQKQYGDPAYTPMNFNRSEEDGHLFSTSYNFFLKTVAAPTMTIKIAWLNPDASLPNEVKPGDISGCDHVVLQERTIEKTQAPLTAALRTLLADKTNPAPGNGSLYNYIANGTLKLDSVSITNGIAKIYLVGKAPALNGVCDDPRLFIQVAQTARQFPTVQKVQLFVNGVENTGSGNEQGI